MCFSSCFRKKNLLLALFIGSQVSILAQDTLRLDAALGEALAENQQIKVQRLAARAQAIQVDPSLVGRAPVVNLQSSYEFGWADASVETLPMGPGENEPLQLDGISNDIIVGAEVNMLILDGGASSARLVQLERASDLANIQVDQTIEQTVAQVLKTYYALSLQQAQLDITRANIELTKERLLRMQAQTKYGTGGQLETLQLEVDLRTDSALLRSQELQYDNNRRQLSRLLNRPGSAVYAVESSVDLNTNLELGSLLGDMRSNNRTLDGLDQRIRLAESDVVVQEAAFKPTLTGYANLNYAYLQDDASFLQVNRVVGPNVGVRLNVPIYDGGARRIRLEAATITRQQRELERTSAEDNLAVQLENAYATYRNSLYQWDVERSNLPLFERNLENLENNLELGLVTNTDVRTAQLSLTSARQRVAALKYAVKQAEIDLYLFTGQLVRTE